jgi:hypothetical protein
VLAISIASNPHCENIVAYFTSDAPAAAVFDEIEARLLDIERKRL